MKELIVNYMYNVNWNGNWNLDKIKEELSSILQNKCTVDVTYKRDVILNEVIDGSEIESKEIRSVDSITVVYLASISENGVPMYDKIDIKL